MTADADGPSLVLIAEDEPLASMALRAQVEALGHEVLGPARDGDEAVALGACFPIDFALFDGRMPGRSGLEAAHELFDIAPTPIVLLTGMGAADLPHPVPRPPIFHVLTKPTDLAGLQEGIRRARAAFDEWSRQTTAHPALDRASRSDRALVARAVEATAGEGRPAPAAARLLQRAREEGRTPAEIARDILRGSAP